MNLAKPHATSSGTSTSPNNINDADLERTAASSISSASYDPLKIRNGIVPEGELADLRRRKKGKHIEKYHRRQNNLITAMLKPMEEHTEDARNEVENARIPVRIAVWASLIANFFLCVLQMYAAISSGSLSLLATGIDSVFDVGSNVVLYWLHKKATRMDVNRWPVGGARLQNIGNIVYGFAMGSVNLVVIVESVRSLITKDTDKAFHLASILAVAVALGVKLGLFLYCYSLRKQSSQVEVLWEDHRNDLYINGFGILMSAGGSKLRWYLDPAGAVIIALGVIVSWGITIYQEFELLAGKSAPHDFIQLIIYKATMFNDDIQGIDTVRAYHSGPNYFVEVDIVMAAETPLWKAHDISQQLQDKIEVLPNVERAFVHVDHETTHTPEHRKIA
ncbi:hypothetical protein PLICRDRAFT_39610 [Plicaturopsis crispa FD-325 SS-3]|nr:hypothetical protein PLICRDRAFT_39610 [Plicaturopsis crispa FD-325 SS-3]